MKGGNAMKKKLSITNLNGITDDDKTCGLTDMNCVADDEDTTCGLTDMNCVADDEDKTCGLTDMNCVGDEE